MASNDPEATQIGETPAHDLVVDELILEEVSIDGMCGVY